MLMAGTGKVLGDLVGWKRELYWMPQPLVLSGEG